MTLGKKLNQAVFLVLGLSVGFIPMAIASGPTYYVSATTGNDGWSGTLAAPNALNTDGPFLTLGRAKTAMQNSPTIKSATLRAGTYSIKSTNLTFSSQDNGETWIAYACETAILEGGGTGYISGAGVTNLTFQNLVIQNLGIGPHGAGMYLNGSGHTVRGNTFLNCTQSCFSGSSLTNAVIDSNIMNGQSPGNPPRSTATAYSTINLWYGSSNNRITHNLIENAQGAGIAFADGVNHGVPDPPINNNLIDRNILQNVNTNVKDSGALYMYDETRAGVGNQITNNIVNGNGGTAFLTNWTKAIYLDGHASNVLVSGNVCRNCGQYAFMIHGGDHNMLINNIFDLSGGALLGFYQIDSSPAPDTGMSNNVFKQNIIYVSNAASNPLWHVQISVKDALPADSKNLYYSAGGAGISNSQPPIETNPVYANPQFTNPSMGNYAMPSTSPAFSQLGFQALPTDQGPLPNACTATTPTPNP